jgi:hypothetical protein
LGHAGLAPGNNREDTQMTIYEISNIDTGEYLGKYAGITIDAALDAMARDYGFADYDACIADYGVARQDAIDELHIVVCDF